MTEEEGNEFLQTLWKTETRNSIHVAERVMGDQRLSPEIMKYIPEFSALMTRLQKAAFLHGASAVLHAGGAISEETFGERRTSRPN